MKKQLWLLCLLLPVSNALAAWPIQLPLMNDAAKAKYSSADFPKAIFVVEAFFDGCHWCHVNAPKVNGLSAEFKSNDRVQFLDVGVDDRDEDYKHWISTTAPNHPVLKDPNGGSFLGDFNVEGYPTTLVFDCNGKELYRHVGNWGNNGTDEVRNAVQTALASPDCK